MPRLKLYSVFVGARNSRSRFTLKDERLIQRISLSHFRSGCSILKVSGTWYDARTGKFRTEQARQILITADDRRTLARWALEIGEALNQEELLLVEIGPAQRVVTARHRRRRQKSGEAKRRPA